MLLTSWHRYNTLVWGDSHICSCRIFLCCFEVIQENNTHFYGYCMLHCVHHNMNFICILQIAGLTVDNIAEIIYYHILFSANFLVILCFAVSFSYEILIMQFLLFDQSEIHFY